MYIYTYVSSFFNPRFCGCWMNPGYKSSEFLNEIFSAKAQKEVQSESMKIILAQSSLGKASGESW